MTGITRRQMAGLLAGLGAALRLKAAEIPVGLNHIKLRVADLDRSVAFYYQLFGGPAAEIQGGSYLTPPDMRAVFLKIGSGKTYLVLSPPDPTVRVGLEHVALDRAGLFVADQHWMPHAFPLDSGYVRDPDGNLLEFANSGFWQSDAAKQSAVVPAGATGGSPVFEPVTIRAITLRTRDVTRSASFYRLFGDEVGDAEANGRRRIDFQGTLINLVGSVTTARLDGFTVWVRRFDDAIARRRLRAMGVSASGRGTIVLHDPDGNRVEIAAEP